MLSSLLRMSFLHFDAYQNVNYLFKTISFHFLESFFLMLQPLSLPIPRTPTVPESELHDLTFTCSLMVPLLWVFIFLGCKIPGDMSYMLVYRPLPTYNTGIQNACNKLFSINQVLEYHLATLSSRKYIKEKPEIPLSS